jgi:hypothetical protein
VTRRRGPLDRLHHWWHQVGVWTSKAIFFMTIGGIPVVHWHLLG